MNILVSTDESYVFQTLVMLESLFATNNDDFITVYAFLRNVNKKQQEYMMNYVNEKGHLLVPVEINDSDYEIIGVDKYSNAINSTHHLTMAAYNRLLCTFKLDESIDRVIYLDSDIIVNKSLGDLYNYDIDNYAAAVVEGFAFKDYDYIFLATNNEEVTKTTIDFANKFRITNNIEPDAKYFNSGVMVINLNYLRNNGFTERVKKHVVSHECTADADQSVLNAVLKDEVVYVSHLFNCRPSNYNKKHKSFLEKQAYIFHYGIKPWNDYKTFLGGKWWKYAFKVNKKNSFKTLYKCVL